MNIPISKPSVRFVVSLTGLFVAVVLGSVAAHDPGHAVLLGSGCLVAGLVIWINRTVKELCLLFLFSLVIGYLVFGRAFAYVGFPPLYVGEIGLFTAFVAILLGSSGQRVRIYQLPVFLFVFWGVIRTVPYLDIYGLNAIRDAALYYYAFFAVAVYLAVTKNEAMMGIGLFVRLIPVYFIIAVLQVLLPVIAILPEPTWPGAPVGFFTVKPADRAVVLVLIAAIRLLGLDTRFSTRYRLPSIVFWSFWSFLALVVFIGTRGGALAILIPMALLFVMRRGKSREWVRLTVLVTVVVSILAIWNPTIQLGSYREFSIGQLTANFTSIFSDSESNSGGVNSNREWRTEFWSAAVADTVSTSKFWDGSGFGINLATEYGFSTSADQSLRSPHNVWVTVFARMGIIGLGLWILLILSVASRVVNSLRKSSDEQCMLTVQSVAMFAIAGLVTAAFDVYLEGPQGAIPFWMGIGLIWLFTSRGVTEDDHIGESSAQLWARS